MAFKMKGFSYPGVSPVKMKMDKKPPASKPKKQKYRTKMEAEYMKDPDAYEKKYSRKQIDKDVAKADRITAKRASAKRGLKANQESGNVPGKKRSGMKLKKSPTKMMKKSAAKLKKSPAKKTYDEAYDALPASEKKKYYDQSTGAKGDSARDRFKAAAKKYNKKTYGTEEPTKTAKSKNITKKELSKQYKQSKTTPAPKPKPKKETKLPVTEKKMTVSDKKTIGPKNRVTVKSAKKSKKKAITEARQKSYDPDRKTNRKLKRKAVKDARKSGREAVKEARATKRLVKKTVKANKRKEKAEAKQAVKTAKRSARADKLDAKISKSKRPNSRRNLRRANKANRLRGFV